MATKTLTIEKFHSYPVKLHAYEHTHVEVYTYAVYVLSSPKLKIPKLGIFLLKVNSQFHI